MLNGNLGIKKIGGQLGKVAEKTVKNVEAQIDEAIKRRECLDKIRGDKEEIIKQLILIDMMKEEMLKELNQTNMKLRAVKKDIETEERHMRQQMIHKLYPDIFKEGAFEYDAEIDSVNGNNYRD